MKRKITPYYFNKCAECGAIGRQKGRRICMKCRLDPHKRLKKLTSRVGECLEWIGCKRPNGYGVIVLSGKYVSAHRFSYELTNGPIKNGMDVLHKCDNPSCVEPRHLFLGTQQDNMRDMAAKGRSLTGEKNPLAKLSWLDVEVIRALRLEGVTLQRLADKYAVDKHTILSVVQNKTWRLA